MRAGLLPCARTPIFRGPFKEARTTAGPLAQVPSHVWPKAGVTHGESAGPGPAVSTSLAPDIRRIAITNKRLIR
jgi:hypothetical protein